MPKSAHRAALEELSFVSRTWYEWELRENEFKPVLIVEVKNDTDVNQNTFLNQRDIVLGALRDVRTTAMIHTVRIVPASKGASR